MRKITVVILLVFSGIMVDAQQLPVFTQFVANELLINPAVAGTKRTFDFRLTYRDQWVGFPGAPVTEAVSLNYSILNKMGIAAYAYQDVTGFTQRSNYALCYAFQIHFNDITFSFGMSGSMVNYAIDENKITINQTADPAIDRAINTNVWAPNACAGGYLYSDRWRFGISAINLIPSTEKFYKTYGFPADTSKAGALQLISHFYTYLSYVYSANEDFKWQNNLLVNYTAGAPIYIAYDLRCHIQSTFIAGFAISLNDDVALELGAIIHNNFQICYSYDYVTSQIGHFTSGSDEVTLIYNFDKKGKAGGFPENNSSFRKRKYGYMF